MSDFAHTNSCEKLKLKLTQTDLDLKVRNFRGKYIIIVIFNHTNYYHIKFLSCLGGGGGEGKSRSKYLSCV